MIPARGALGLKERSPTTHEPSNPKRFRCVSSKQTTETPRRCATAARPPKRAYVGIAVDALPVVGILQQ
eukprot:8659946-Pyramimonas_sp.AAC.1